MKNDLTITHSVYHNLTSIFVDLSIGILVFVCLTQILKKQIIRFAKLKGILHFMWFGWSRFPCNKTAISKSLMTNVLIKLSKFAGYNVNLIVGWCKLFKTFFKTLRSNAEWNGRQPSSIYCLNKPSVNLQ